MFIDPLQIGVSLLLGVSIFLLIWTVFRYPVPDAPPLHRRIAVALGTGKRATAFELPLIKPVMHVALTCAQHMNVPSLRRFTRRHLDACGNPNGYSIDEYLAICLMCGLLLAMVAGMMSIVVLGQLNLLGWAIMGVAGCAIPLFTVKQAGERRMRRIARQLPYTLDLIALMMAAGSTFTEAITTIVRDEPDDPFNEELRIVLAQIDFGSTRATALADMAQRIPSDALRSIVGAINQAEALGTPLATILKSQSDMLRMHRSVRAEKVSATADLRILFPTMLILIAVVLILFGPLAIRLIRGELM
jgi:tight adherence protein C